MATIITSAAGTDSSLIPNHALRLLIVDDTPADAELILACLKRAGYALSFDIVDAPAPFQQRLQQSDYDLIISDHNLGPWTGLDVLELLRKSGKSVPFIVVTGTLGDEAAVQYIKSGASDYVLKHRLEALPPAVSQTLREKAHRDQEARLYARIVAAKKEWELTFDSVPDAVLIIDDQCRVQRANRAATEALETPFAKLIGRPCYEVLHGVSQPPPDCPHSRLLAVRVPQRSDFIEPRLGKTFDVTTTPVRDATGSFLGCIHVMRDITDRKKTEQALQQSEEQLRLLLTSTAEAIYGLNHDGNCTFANPACLRLLGYRNLEEVIGRNMHSLTHHTHAEGSPYPEKESPIYAAFHESRRAHVDDEILWRKDGTSFPVEYWSYPIEKDGQTVGAVVAFLDISERKRTEEALRQSEEKYREFIENATYGFLRSNLEGTLLDVNPALVSMLGYGSKDELLQRSLDRDIYDNPTDSNSTLQALQRDGRVDGIEVSWRRKDRVIIVVRLSGRVIHSHDRATHFEGMVEDITERRILEDQFRQAQKMEAVGRLAGGIAHDFNNLLSVIIGYSDLMLSTLPVDDPGHRRVEEIRKAGHRAASLTRQMLAFSRKQVLMPKIIDLNTVVGETSKMLSRLLGEDVELITKLGTDLDKVKADPNQMEQVIMNLAINARDAMPNGGKLFIETANVTLDQHDNQLHHIEAPPGNYVALSVSDTGIGMDKETQSRMFEPFFTTKDVGKGTGLGLATVYGIVKQSGGHIRVESEIGKGSAFKVFMPQAREMLEQIQPLSTKPFLSGTGTILLVEDEVSLRQLSHQLLESMGYKVMKAANGAEAIRIARQCLIPIHLLITDVVMPGMNGRELAELLCATRPQMKVLYVSGHTDDMLVQYAIFKPGASFLQKPFSREDLARKIQQILGISVEKSEKRGAGQ
ncbi:MAG: PAS domain S-box protein [Terriglobales bacterium]